MFDQIVGSQADILCYASATTCHKKQQFPYKVEDSQTIQNSETTYSTQNSRCTQKPEHEKHAHDKSSMNHTY